MKKNLFTAVLALFSVVAFAQEKPQNTESKQVCTEQCDHGAMAKKSCCSEKTTASASCADKPKQTAAAGENKSCCSKPAGAGTEK
ncbi:MAG: hypothetical protein ISQ96_05340 [Cryomorphaceae bacterium]|nr:hypothetical protein [Cryomorphaceae bacterium]